MSGAGDLRDRVRASSAEQVTVEEMVRLGFWTEEQEERSGHAALLLEKHELQDKIAALSTEARRQENIEFLRVQAHKARLAAARQKRIETRARREQERKDRAAAWKARREREILHLGPGVSVGLTPAQGGDPGRLADAHLPVLPDLPALATALDVTVGTLRWFAFHREVSETSHYVHFAIPKKTGGLRHISAPMPRLKAAQRRIADWLVAVPLHDAAHGFVPGRSIVSNAAQHTGRSVVINFDLQSFFPSISWLRVRGVFEQLGYGRPVATVLALICTAAPTEQLEVDGKRWFVHTGDRVLPPGSPASPVLTNLICRRLDARLTGLGLALGFDYTRYADDLTFSARPDADEVKTGLLLKCVAQVVADEDLTLHPDKTRVMHRGRRQEVTGLVVNERVAVPREHLRRYRAVIHKLRTQGPESLSWGDAPSVFTGLQGFAAFVHMVDVTKGRAMLDDVRAHGSAHGWTPPRPPVVVPPDLGSPDGEPGENGAKEGVFEYITGGATKKWWQFWR